MSESKEPPQAASDSPGARQYPRTSRSARIAFVLAVAWLFAILFVDYDMFRPAFGHPMFSEVLTNQVFLMLWAPWQLAVLVFALLGLRTARRSEGAVGGSKLALGAILILGLTFVVGGVVIPITIKEKGNARKADCVAHEKQLVLALLKYAEKHNNTLPDARRWSDEILPYAGDKKIFVCPNGRDRASGYAYNAALSGMKLDSIKNSEEVVAIFESDKPWNAAGGAETLPKVARHSGGDIFGYADGHVKWMHESRLKNLLWNPGAERPRAPRE